MDDEREGKLMNLCRHLAKKMIRDELSVRVKIWRMTIEMHVQERDKQREVDEEE